MEELAGGGGGVGGGGGGQTQDPGGEGGGGKNWQEEANQLQQLVKPHHIGPRTREVEGNKTGRRRPTSNSQPKRKFDL